MCKILYAIKRAFECCCIPILQKWGCYDQRYDAIYQQARHEMQQADFHVTWNLLTVWGRKPGA